MYQRIKLRELKQISMIAAASQPSASQTFREGHVLGQWSWRSCQIACRRDRPGSEPQFPVKTDKNLEGLKLRIYTPCLQHRTKCA